MTLSQADRDAAAAAKQRAEDFHNLHWEKVTVSGEDFEWKVTAHVRRDTKRPELSVRSVHPITINRIRYLVSVSLYRRVGGAEWMTNYQNSAGYLRITADGRRDYDKPVTDIARHTLDSLVESVVEQALAAPGFLALTEIARRIAKQSPITDAYSQLQVAEASVAEAVARYSSP